MQLILERLAGLRNPEAVINATCIVCTERRNALVASLRLVGDLVLAAVKYVRQTADFPES
jgi:hypothetical protein